MADGTIGLDEPTTIDKRLDTESLTVGANTVERERNRVAGLAAAELADVKNADPTAAHYGLVVRHAPGDTNIGNVDVLTLPALPAGTNNIGDVDVLTLPALPAGTNNIGDVDVLTLPALPAGTNNIGDVDLAQYTPVDVDSGAGTDNAVPVALRLPAAGGGVNAPGDAANGIDVDVTRVAGTVTVDSELPTAAALADAAANPTAPRVGADLEVFNGTTWDRARGDTANGLDVDVTRLPALPAGTNNIGDVDVLTLPALPAGTNNIGDVDVLTQVGAANLANNQVSVTTTAANIVAARATRRSVTIVNHGTTDVYVGVAAVTTANGFLLPGIKGAAVTIETTVAVQGIVASGTQTVSYFEEYA